MPNKDTRRPKHSAFLYCAGAGRVKSQKGTFNEAEQVASGDHRWHRLLYRSADLFAFLAQCHPGNNEQYLNLLALNTLKRSMTNLTKALEIYLKSISKTVALFR